LKEIWNIIGAIAGVLAVTVAVFVFFQDRTDKSQRIEITQVSRTSLVNPELASPSRRVEIMFNGRKVSDYAIFQFRVSNVGGQPIRSADYEVPLGLTFSNVGEVLWAEQTSAEPKSLSVAPVVKDRKIGLSGTLLNPKDWFMLEVAVVPDAGKVPMAEPIGRVAGVKDIEYVQSVPSNEKGKGLLGVTEKYLMGIQAILVLAMLVVQWFFRALLRRKLRDA